MLSVGAKVMVCHRRLFTEDQLRFFIGTVEAYSDGIAKVSGFTWTRDSSRGFQRKADRRTKLVSIASGNLIVYELPESLQVEDVRIGQPGGQKVTASDGAKFHMDLSEHL